MNEDVIVVPPKTTTVERKVPAGKTNDSQVEALRTRMHEEVVSRMQRDGLFPSAQDVEVEVIVRATGVGYKPPSASGMEADEFARLARVHDGRRPVAIVGPNYGMVRVER